MYEDYVRDGKAERAAGIAGRVNRRRYEVDGKPHRLDGPAIVHYRPEDGSVREEYHYTEGKRHRTDGPAIVVYQEDGSVYSTSYYRNGELHRIDGPAHTQYSPDGSVKLATYALEGEKLGVAQGGDDSRERAALAGYLGSISLDVAEEYVLDSPYAELLDEEVHAHRITEILAAGVSTPDGVREVLGGAPVEWVRAYEESR